jgi:hypothetical protein
MVRGLVAGVSHENFRYRSLKEAGSIWRNSDEQMNNLHSAYSAGGSVNVH